MFSVDKEAYSKKKEQLYSKIANFGDDSSSKSNNRSTENTIFVGNLSEEVNQASLESFFASCGTIKSVYIPIDKNTGTHRGIAFITFQNSSGFLQGMARDRDVFMGKEIKVSRSQKK